MSRARIAAHSGVLVVDKASGLTSFDVVARARRALGERRIGHAGTLDPGAVGVLPLLVGEATKMMAYLVEQDKEYVAIVRLGVATDTQDLSGRIIATKPRANPRSRPAGTRSQEVHRPHPPGPTHVLGCPSRRAALVRARTPGYRGCAGSA